MKGQEEYSKFVNMIFNESKRAAIIVGAAYIDDEIKELIIAKLPNIHKSNFEFNGPIGSFSSRITMAHALGILSDNVKSQIDIIRKIRNDAAHGLEDFDLDSESNKSRISEIHKNFGNKDFFDSMLKEAGDIYKIYDNDAILRMIISLTLGRLFMHKTIVKPLDYSNAITQIPPFA